MSDDSFGYEQEFVEFAAYAEAHFKEAVADLLTIGSRYVGSNGHEQIDLKSAMADLTFDEGELVLTAEKSLRPIDRGDLLRFMTTLLQAAFRIGSHDTASNQLDEARKALSLSGGRRRGEQQRAESEKWKTVCLEMARSW